MAILEYLAKESFTGGVEQKDLALEEGLKKTKPPYSVKLPMLSQAKA